MLVRCAILLRLWLRLQRTPASSSIRMRAAQVGVLDRMRQLKRVQLPLLGKANSVCGWYAMLHGRCQL